MDEKRTVSVEQVDERTVRLTTEQGSEDFFLPIRDFYLDVVLLATRHQMRFKAPYLSRCITGTGVIEDLGISVIGAPATVDTSIKVSFHPLSDSEYEAAYERVSADILRADEEKDASPGRWQDSPVTLGFQPADWETGIEDEWWLQLLIPQTVFDSFWDALTARITSAVHIGVSFRNLYTDEPHAPPSVPVDWFLRPDREGYPEFALGLLRVLSYESGPSELAPAGRARKNDDLVSQTTTAAEAVEISERRHQETLKFLDDMTQSVKQIATDTSGGAGNDKVADRRHYEILEALGQVGQSLQKMRKTARNVGWTIAVAALMQACSAMFELTSK